MVFPPFSNLPGDGAASRRGRRLRWLRLAGLLAVTGILVARAPGEEAQGLNFQVRSWHVEDGLPDGTITALARTPDGYLWVGTPKGLARFDGARFSAMPGPEDDPVAALAADQSGHLWILHDSGRIRIWGDGGARQVLEPQRDRPSSEPGWFDRHLLAAGRNGEMLVLDGDRTLRRFREGRVVAVERAQTGEDRGPVAVLSDAHGRPMVVGSTRVSMDERTDSGGGSPEGSGSLRFPGVVCASREETLWAVVESESGQGGRLARVSPRRGLEEWLDFPPDEVKARMPVSALCEDGAGRLWVCRWWNGLLVHTKKRGWERLPTPGPLAKCVVTTLFLDQADGLWVGTIGEGLHHVVERPVTMIRLPEEAASAAVTTVCYDPSGAWWAGTGGRGLFRFDGDQVRQFGPDDGLPSAEILSALVDRRGQLWVGTAKGLVFRKSDRFQAVAGLSKEVLAMTEDKEGGVWFGHWGGLARLAPDGTGTAYHPVPSASLDIRSIQEGPDGRVRVATFNEGVWEVEGVALVPARGRPTLPHADLRCLHVDAQGVWWLGTLYHGLYRWDGTKLSHYTREDGLGDDSILALVEDGDGNLWASSSNGVFGMARSTLASYERGKTPSLLCWGLGPAEGLANRGCSGGGQPVLAADSAGHLGVANMVGVGLFDPKEVVRRRAQPELMIESLEADGIPVRPQNGMWSVPARTSRYEVHCAAPDLEHAASQRFRFRLEPLDPDWIEAGVSRTATYSRLAPGAYRFRAMVGGADGRWHEAREPLALVVVPRFWQRPWFVPLVTTGAVAAVAGGLALLGRARLRRRLEVLEMRHAVDRERARIARDIHDDLGTSLTEIVFISEGGGGASGPGAAPDPRLDRIAAKARSSVQALDEIVWAVNPRNDNLAKLADYLCSCSEELCETAGLRCWHEVPTVLPERPLSVDFRHNLFLVVKEAVHNAVRHAGGSEVRLRLEAETTALRVTVEDNGHGFDSDADGAGNGLSNMRNRVRELGGRVEWKPGAGRGTTVAIEVPWPTTID